MKQKQSQSSDVNQHRAETPQVESDPRQSLLDDIDFLEETIDLVDNGKVNDDELIKRYQKCAQIMCGYGFGKKYRGLEAAAQDPAVFLNRFEDGGGLGFGLAFKNTLPEFIVKLRESPILAEQSEIRSSVSETMGRKNPR